VVVSLGPGIRYVDVSVVQSVGPLPLSSTYAESLEGNGVLMMVHLGKVPVSSVSCVVDTVCFCITVCNDSVFMQCTVAGSLGGVIPLRVNKVAPPIAVCNLSLCICSMCVMDVEFGPVDLALVGRSIKPIVTMKPSSLSKCSSVIPEVVMVVYLCCTGVFAVPSISPLPLNSTNVECSTGCDVPLSEQMGFGFVYFVSTIVSTLPFNHYICPMCPFPHCTVACSLDAMESPHVRSVSFLPRICVPSFSISCMCEFGV